MTFSRQKERLSQSPEASEISASPEFEAVFEAFFEQHWSRVCGLLYRMIGDWAEAEDLALDAFWKLYRQPPKSAQNLGGWLYRVASNLGINALRAQQRRQRYEQEAGQAVISASPADVATIVEQEQQRQQVRRALARMKPRSAQLLIFRHSGLSYEEIAATLQVSASSVGSLLTRAEKEFVDRYREEQNR